MLAIAVQDVSKSYGVRTVLSGVSLDIPATGRIGVVGANGAGKSTLLRLLAGEPPDAGRIMRHPRLGIRLLPQDLETIEGTTWERALDALEWLEAFLTRFPGAVVVASHDRRFLDAVAARIVELDGGTAHVYAGNYSAYAASKAQERAAQVAAFEQYRQEVERLREFVHMRLQRASRLASGPKRGRDHYGRVAKKVARGAKAAQKRLARFEAEAPQKPVETEEVRVRFAAAARPGEALAHLRFVTIRYGERPVLADVNLTLGRGARIGLTGVNGSGKTSLLRLLAKQTVPSTGEVWMGPGVRTGYLSQQPDEPAPGRRVIDVALDAGLPPAEARAVLAALLFRGERLFQPIGTLSGGERTRLAVFELLSRRVNLLLLDEPTNHLDLPSRERLEEALEVYAGTLVIATHDRYLLRRLCTSIWAIGAGTVRELSGAGAV